MAGGGESSYQEAMIICNVRIAKSGRLCRGIMWWICDCWGRVEEDRAMARSYSLTNEAQSVEWRIVVSGGVVFRFYVGFIFVSSLIHGICIQSVPWCACGWEDLYHQKWVMGVDSTFWGWSC